MLSVALLALAIHTNFEGGRLGRIQKAGPAHFVCGVAGQVDQDGRNRQANWYYFRLDGAAGRDVTIDLVDLPGEYNYRPNRGAVTGDTIPVFSYDRKTWRHFEKAQARYDSAVPRLTLRFRPTAARVWIAHVPPYTNGDLARLLAAASRSPFLKSRIIGKSAGGRDLLLLTITDPAVPDAAKKVFWLMFRQHAWEAGSSWAGEGAIRFLLSADPQAARIRRQALVQVFPLCDPDGVARGGVRFNLHGFDLNRNWDTVNPAQMPEIAAQRRAVLDWVDSGHRVDLFLSLHNTETNEYLEGPPDARFRPLLERWFRLLAENTTFNPQQSPRLAESTTTPGKPGRMTVVQGLYHDRGIPAFLMEQMIAYNSKLGRLPEVPDRLRFGADLVRTLLPAVGSR